MTGYAVTGQLHRRLLSVVVRRLAQVLGQGRLLVDNLDGLTNGWTEILHVPGR